jgi:hypothetical protein
MRAHAATIYSVGPRPKCHPLFHTTLGVGYPTPRRGLGIVTDCGEKELLFSCRRREGGAGFSHQPASLPYRSLGLMGPKIFGSAPKNFRGISTARHRIIHMRGPALTFFERPIGIFFCHTRAERGLTATARRCGTIIPSVNKRAVTFPKHCLTWLFPEAV